MNPVDTTPAKQQEPAEKYPRGMAQKAFAAHGFVVVVVGGLSMSTSLKARRACSRYGRSVGFV